MCVGVCVEGRESRLTHTHTLSKLYVKKDDNRKRTPDYILLHCRRSLIEDREENRETHVTQSISLSLSIVVKLEPEVADHLFFSR